jgi:hypothetical protein
MTTTTAAAHIGEVWVNDVIRAQEYSFEIAPRVYRQWKFVGHGDVYHIPRVGSLTANSKSAGGTWTPEAITDSEQTLTINVHEVAGIQVDDIVQVLNNTDVKAEYQKKLGYALGRSLEVNLAALPASFSQIVGTLGVELTWDNLRRAWQYLADAGIPLQDDCTWFFSPAAISGFLAQDIIVNAMYGGDAKSQRAIEQAKVGTLLGAPVIQTNLTRAPAASQSESFLMNRRAIALMMAQEPKVVTEYRADSLSWIVGSHQIYGYTEVDRYIETPSSTSTTDNWAVLLRTIG